MIDCIETTYCRHPQGYGLRTVAGKTVMHHRLVYCEHNNCSLESIAGLLVLHSCDTPPCVNPEHLSLGTHKDNTQDMIAKGRRKGGEKKQLSDEQVTVINSMKGIKTQDEIALLLGISRTTVWRVLRNVRNY